MPAHRASQGDQTLRLAVEGYGWLSNLRRRERTETVRVRLLGQPAVGLYGPDAARFFYDEEHVRRHGAIPGAVHRVPTRPRSGFVLVPRQPPGPERVG